MKNFSRDGCNKKNIKANTEREMCVRKDDHYFSYFQLLVSTKIVLERISR